MKYLFLSLLLIVVQPAMGAVVTFNFQQLLLSSEDDDKQARVDGVIEFNNANNEYNTYQWSKFEFNFNFDDTLFLLTEDNIEDIEFVDLEDLLFGDDEGGERGYGEGFILTFNEGDFTLAAGVAGLGYRDTCFYSSSGEYCAGGLFEMSKFAQASALSVSVDEPRTLVLIPLLLVFLFSCRKRGHKY